MKNLRSFGLDRLKFAPSVVMAKGAEKSIGITISENTHTDLLR